MLGVICVNCAWCMDMDGELLRVSATALQLHTLPCRRRTAVSCAAAVCACGGGTTLVVAAGDPGWNQWLGFDM